MTDITHRLANWAECDLRAEDVALAAKYEIERLRAGGCARDQGTTQFCAEAAGLAAENERLRAALRDIATGQVTYLPFIQTVARAALEEKHD